MRLILALPFAFILVLFALSNRQTVALGIWPTDYAWQVPLSLAMLAAAALAFLVGALFTWMASLRQRRRARRAEEQVRLLEAQVAELKARLPAAQIPARHMPALTP